MVPAEAGGQPCEHVSRVCGFLTPQTRAWETLPRNRPRGAAHGSVQMERTLVTLSGKTFYTSLAVPGIDQ